METKTQKEKIQKLLKLGYKKDYIQLCLDEKFSNVRWSLDDLLWIESLKGKKIEIFNNKIITITDIRPAVIGCSIFFKGGCVSMNKQRFLNSHNYPNAIKVQIIE